MFEADREDILEYCLGFMISKQQRLEFLQQRGIEVKTQGLSCRKAAQALRSTSGFEICLDHVRPYMRAQRPPFDIDLHLEILESGLLAGHNWHGAMPSILHRSFQDKVRLVCSGELPIGDYLKIATDIAAQELFIVATHDLCEAQIIRAFPNVIPSISSRGVTDFIFNSIPFDLKCSGIPRDWTLARARKYPLEFAKSLYAGADTERLRKQASNSINDWALNRFYVIVEDADAWLREPKGTLEKIVSECQELKAPIVFRLAGLQIGCHLVFIG